MKQLNPTQNGILQILGDGLCHSGNEIGNQLGISRSAVWKQINQLLALGIGIITLPQQGYQLPAPLILLNEPLLKKKLQPHVNVHIFSQINSTNAYLKTLENPLAPMDKEVHLIDICCAESQTQGRGRFGRHWHSPFGENIYCSTRWLFHCDLSTLSGLSLVTGLAILKTVKTFGADTGIGLKWPNDIIWKNKKLSGILIEILAESHGFAQVIIGIGLNVHSDSAKHPLPDKPWCSLKDIFQQEFDRNLLIIQLIHDMEYYLNLFFKQGLQPLLPEWHAHDYLINKRISVQQPQQILHGCAQGINQWGQLILKDDLGKIHHLSSGDTSILLGGVSPE